mgnify:CR=1 FL=1
MPNFLRHSRNGQGELPVRTAAPLRFAQNVACCAHRQLALAVAPCGRFTMGSANCGISNQWSQTLRYFPQNRQHAVDSLLGGLMLNRHAHRQSPLHIPFVVTQGHGHTSVGQIELLLGQSPVLRTNARQFGAHALGVGDGVRGEGFELMVGQPRVRFFFAQDWMAKMDNHLPLLTLPEDDMRRMAEKVFGLIVDHFTGLKDLPVTTPSTLKHITEGLHEPMPTQAVPVEQLLAQLKTHVFDQMTHLDHPRYFAFVPGPSNFVSAMADAIASSFNVFSGAFIGPSGVAQIEVTTIEWLRELFRFPQDAGGLFVSGGSMVTNEANGVAYTAKIWNPSKDRKSVV